MRERSGSGDETDLSCNPELYVRMPLFYVGGGSASSLVGDNNEERGTDARTIDTKHTFNKRHFGRNFLEYSHVLTTGIVILPSSKSLEKRRKQYQETAREF